AFEDSATKLATYPECLIRYEWQGTRTAADARGPETEGGRVLFASYDVDATVTRLQRQAVRGACGKTVGFDELPVLSRDGLKEALRRGVSESKPFSVLHVLCHGVPLDSGGTAFGLKWLDRAPVMEANIESDLKEFAPTLRLVVLSACSSGEAGASGSYVGSVAKGVHRAGIEAVVASRLPLSREGSIEFTRQFYQGLIVDASSVEEAFLAARNGLGAPDPRLDARQLETDQLSLQLYARERDGFDTRPLAFSPYQGLRPFRREHKRFFCGRDVEVGELVSEFEALVGGGKKPRFMMVMGASGSGKSSMVLAGAVPLIEAKGWVSAEILPGDAPL
ncbi:MAG: CHAT domain-containing protein, partial [Spirochaetaceae bacterium]|nr:CHAT domain-containing protein [Spirochaetaceae bacterium]